MTQGITALPGAQQPQNPGQAAPVQALPAAQPKTPASEIAPYKSMPLQQLIDAFRQRPSGPLLGLITKKAEAEKLEQQMAQQRAMGAYVQQGPQTVKDIALANAMQAMRPTQMARHGGVMHGYAGGGAVAFADGGISVGYDRDYNDARRFGINLSPYDAPAVRAEKLQRVQRMREFEEQQKTQGRAEIPNEFAIANMMAGYRDPRRGRLDIPAAPPAAAVAAVPPPVPAPRPPRADRPGTGMAAAPAPVATPAPPVDRYGDIERERVAGIRALQNLIRGQREEDPELARLRQAAYESAQGITTRRERDRAAALEAAQKATGAPLLENQEALLRMAASLGGAKRFGEALSRAAGAAGEVRGEQRKALEAAQKVSREEQNAIDQLNQALAEKRVADRSGSVERQRQADLEVAKAELKVGEIREGIQKQRGVEADREEQRKIAREQMANQLRVAQVGAAARTEGMADPRKVYDTIIDNVQKEYDQWAKTVDGVRATPEQKAAKRKALLEQQVRIASAAGVKGLEALLAAGAAPPPAAGNDPLGIRKP
jgi:hypothetical protein